MHDLLANQANLQPELRGEGVATANVPGVQDLERWSEDRDEQGESARQAISW